MKQTAELFVGNVLADRRANKTRAKRVRNCGTVAVKQTAELFVDNVLADRRANKTTCVAWCPQLQDEMSAELTKG
ncbi:hypothetical protein [Bifidobacterium hapali]|uniref:hypothetical protein n=1 Tax=Bifidobacterium hapali TaxID=1630172 RepID=UPI000B9BB0CA|nr:hypothetical protein [Bifidobacterium hapali]